MQRIGNRKLTRERMRMVDLQAVEYRLVLETPNVEDGNGAIVKSHLQDQVNNASSHRRRQV